MGLFQSKKSSLRINESPFSGRAGRFLGKAGLKRVKGLFD